MNSQVSLTEGEVVPLGHQCCNLLMGGRQNVSGDPDNWSSRYNHSSIRLMPVGVQSVQEQCWGGQVGKDSLRVKRSWGSKAGQAVPSMGS